MNLKRALTGSAIAHALLLFLFVGNSPVETSSNISIRLVDVNRRAETASSPAPKSPLRPRAVNPSRSPSSTVAPTSSTSAPPTKPEGLATTAYTAELARRIDRAKFYPPAAQRRREEGKVILRLTIDRTGRLTAAALAESSSREILDAAALETVAKVTFEPLPAEVEGDTLSVTVPIEYRLD